MRGKPVRDALRLACQRHIDHLFDGPHATTPEETRDVLGALYRSMQDAWSPVRPLRLPATDEAVHRAWDRYLAPGGSGERYRPLLVAAAVKIATEAGPDTVDGETGGSGHARPNWGARQSGQRGEVELAANRFGGRCRHSGCSAWVPAGHGVVLGDTDGWDTYCPRHAQAFTRRARSREHTGPDAFTEPCLRFLDARLHENSAWARGRRSAPAADRGPAADSGRLRGHRCPYTRGQVSEVRRTVPAAALSGASGLPCDVAAPPGGETGAPPRGERGRGRGAGRAGLWLRRSRSGGSGWFRPRFRGRRSSAGSTRSRRVCGCRGRRPCGPLGCRAARVSAPTSSI